MLAAASQRTSRIELGTAVTPLGWENPLRLAEDWATVDVLSGGRLNPGFCVGPPMHFDDVRGALYPDTADVEDFTYARVAAAPCASCAGSRRPTSRASRGSRTYSGASQPHSPGLRSRLWYGGGGRRSPRGRAARGSTC